MSTSSPVKLANKASSIRLAGLIRTSVELLSKAYQLHVLHSHELRRSQRESLWKIFEVNMSKFYQDSSFGWHPPTKQRELFHDLSRFILVNDADILIAFVMFRFEVEDDEDVLYCYDLQIAESAQGMGLGKTIIKELAKIGKATSMEKMMLTVLKANIRAKSFYGAVGFTLDPTSPNYEDELQGLEAGHEVDYEILSRKLLA